MLAGSGDPAWSRGTAPRVLYRWPPAPELPRLAPPLSPREESPDEAAAEDEELDELEPLELRSATEYPRFESYVGVEFERSLDPFHPLLLLLLLYR
jgi:hypothetical protein